MLQLKIRIAWVTTVWQTGHSPSVVSTRRFAQSMQNILWPQGTNAATTSLVKHTTHSLLFLAAEDDPSESVGLLQELPWLPAELLDANALALDSGTNEGKAASPPSSGSLRMRLAGGCSLALLSELDAGSDVLTLLLRRGAWCCVVTEFNPSKEELHRVRSCHSDWGLPWLTAVWCTGGSNPGESIPRSGDGQSLNIKPLVGNDGKGLKSFSFVVPLLFPLVFGKK